MKKFTQVCKTQLVSPVAPRLAGNQWLPASTESLRDRRGLNTVDLTPTQGKKPPAPFPTDLAYAEINMVTGSLGSGNGGSQVISVLIVRKKYPSKFQLKFNVLWHLHSWHICRQLSHLPQARHSCSLNGFSDESSLPIFRCQLLLTTLLSCKVYRGLHKTWYWLICYICVFWGVPWNTSPTELKVSMCSSKLVLISHSIWATLGKKSQPVSISKRYCHEAYKRIMWYCKKWCKMQHIPQIF